jgi:hypothetical protein
MGTQLLKCRDCDKDFPWPPGEQESFRRSGFPPPIRCRSCRKEHREALALEKREQEKQRRQPRITIGDVVQMHLGGKGENHATTR